MSARTEPAVTDDPGWVVVGRIGRAHGLRGDVAVEVRTDVPEIRFAPGARVVADAAGAHELTIAAMTWHSGRLLVRFEGVSDRTGAEALRGLVLRVAVVPGEVPEDPEEFYDRQLLGLRALGPDGEPLGTVTDVVHLPGHDLLAVQTLADQTPAGQNGGVEVLVPFVAQIVVEVDLASGVVRLDPPGGLFDALPADGEPNGR